MQELRSSGPVLTRQVIFLGVLTIFYGVGLIGILLPLHPEFIRLTPFNLLLSLSLVWAAHPASGKPIYGFLALAFAWGFLTEWFGVNTGLLFGDYSYGEVLGPKWAETPIMIGVNWALLAYCSGITANHLLPERPWWVRGTAAAICLVGLDLFIEPVAIRYGFWSWDGQVVPLRNYFGWFMVALPLTCAFAGWFPEARNNVAIGLLILQFLFFSILNFA